MCPRCDELEAEVAYLRDELGIAQSSRRALALRALGLTPAESRVALALWEGRGRAVSFAILADVLPQRDAAADRDDGVLIKVYACRLRQKLGREAIKTVWGHGYALTAEGYAALSEHLEEKAAA